MLDHAAAEGLGRIGRELELRGMVPDGTPVSLRGVTAVMADLIGPGRSMRRVEHYERTEGHRVRMLVPCDLPPAVIVWFHGGGWMIGNVDEWDTFGRELAVATGCAVAMVTYRQAPEDPFPAALDDALAATRWVAAHRRELFGDQVSLMVGGDSAGGNLAAVIAQESVADPTLDVTLQVLAYPVLDCDLDRPSYGDVHNEANLSRAAMQMFWDAYAPDPATRRSAALSPLRAESLAGVPPAVVLLAEHDVLIDEGVAYAERLVEAGVRCASRVFSGQPHGFMTLVNLVPASAVAIDFVAVTVREALAT
jgi:acetyl esterase